MNWKMCFLEKANDYSENGRIIKIICVLKHLCYSNIKKLAILYKGIAKYIIYTDVISVLIPF